MAVSTFAAGNVLTKWSKRVFREYIRDERFSRYSGEGPNNVFQYVMDLQAKAGNVVSIPLVTRLTGDGVEDDDTLENNEEQLGNYADTITPHQLRNAVSRGEYEQSKSDIDILEQGEFMLKKWAMEKLRDLKIARMLAPTADGLTTYASASEADKDTHLGNNTDRYLFGALLSNRSTTDHSASLLNVDTTADTFDRGIVSLLKRIAESADPHISPITTDEDEEWFVIFCGTNPFRDLKADMDTLHSTAAPRSLKENPIFRDGDLVYESCIVRKIPEMASIGTVGAASAPVYQVPLCGLQTVGVGWSRMLTAKTNGPKGSDYENIKGIGVAESRGAKKIIWNSKQHGMVTGYVAAAADA